MEKTISVTDAKRRFLRLLRDVRRGQSFVVTSRGRVVARIAPAGDDRAIGASARSFLHKRLRSEAVVKVGRWQRDELYG
jgi:prevent-host-death family protein